MADGDTHPHAYAHADPDGYTHTYTHAHTHGDSYTHAYAHTHGDAYAHASPWCPHRPPDYGGDREQHHPQLEQRVWRFAVRAGVPLSHRLRCDLRRRNEQDEPDSIWALHM